MNKRTSLLLLALFALPCLLISQVKKASSALMADKVQLPNGWKLSPAGTWLQLGDLPLNMAVSRSKKLMAVSNNGQSVQSIQLIDLVKDEVINTVIVRKSWYGLKFSADNRFLYASGGNDNVIFKYDVSGRKLNLVDSVILGKAWPVKISPTGIEINEATQTMYITTKEDNALYIVNMRTKAILKRIDLGGEAYSSILVPATNTLYISVWGADKVKLLNTKTNNITDSIPVGDNPNELCLSKNNDRLFVANANDNSVSVINTRTKRVIEELSVSLFPKAPTGSTTNGLAVSEDGKTLYIANADNNCLAVFDISVFNKSKSKGFIPTGWYPTNVKVVGQKIYVTNGKGFTSKPNPNGPNPMSRPVDRHMDTAKAKELQYIGGLFKGTLSIIPTPSEMNLGLMTKATYENSPYSKEKELVSQSEEGNPIPAKVGDPSPIKYVFYVIKENRTYDQVLGDMPEGNGDSSLCLFGEKVTPNHHALAREFVLLDNFYVDGEVSMDGHNWTMGAYATDFLEKTWQTSYGGRGGTYSGEGKREIANNKGGFLWDHCKKAGVSYRTYGEFADNGKANIPVLEGHFCPYYTSYGLGTRDTTRFHQWKRDFDSLLALNQVPQFNSVRFGNDHTEGMRLGRPTPLAHMADNDLALGMFIEYLSKSPIWNETAIFVVEDDAQNGPDHVDAHRTIAFVAGGRVKRNFIDHTMYSTSSMLRTIELILGIPPMSQYDAAANSMWRCFTDKVNTQPYVKKPAQIDMNERNVARNILSERSAKFNLAKEDAVPDLEFNEVLWYGVKGLHVPFPGPTRSAFLKLKEETEEEEEDED